VKDGIQDDAESERRDAIVATAVSQLGPQDPDKYWTVVCPALRGRPKTVAWCGGFALWCLRATPDACEWPGGHPWDWAIGKGFAARLPVTTIPAPGDIAYIAEPFQHHAIVERVEDFSVYTIDGNQSPGERVTRRRRPIEDAIYFSIAPLVQRYPDTEPAPPLPPEDEDTKPDAGR
jgi:hypothetical protein